METNAVPRTSSSPTPALNPNSERRFNVLSSTTIPRSRSCPPVLSGGHSNIVQRALAESLSSESIQSFDGSLCSIELLARSFSRSDAKYLGRMNI